MDSDIQNAFDHPEARALATSGTVPLDRISLRDHIVETEIGAFQVERDSTQRLCFNIVVEVNAPTGPLADDVDKILSYDTISQAITHELAVERLSLLETLAERIAERVLLEPAAARIFIRIEKLDRGPGKLGVEIVRRASTHEPEAKKVAADSPQPVIVYLSDEAVAASNFTDYLDGLSQLDQPVIICVGLGDGPIPKASNSSAQRRIDLLAIDQNAWKLAALDARCGVADTWTELDWAARQKKLTVWAPSKIVNDARNAPQLLAGDPTPLLVWFAEELEAAQILVFGEVQPFKTEIPSQRIGVGASDSWRIE